MHELSVVMSIIDIAEKEFAKCNAVNIEEIELEIGELSAVDINAFDFAWQQAVKSTVLEHAHKKVDHIAGQGLCLDCKAVFPMQQLYEPCPVCGGHFVNIQKGKELRVRSLVVN